MKTNTKGTTIGQHIAMLQAGGPGSGRKPTGFHMAINIMGGMKKIGNQMGSNPGGTYQAQSGQKYYIKFPQQHEDQAAAEKLADDVYKAVGHRAPDHTLVTEDGQHVGLAAPMMDVSPMNANQIKDHPQVKDGFIADAYLANWDWAGLNHDNIVRDNKTGDAVRIDNGGSLNFRAQGTQKDFPADKVDELDSMRKPGTHGYAAFADLNDKDLRQQTTRLVAALTDQKIKELISNAGFEDKKAKYYEDRLIGRRNFLAQKFGVGK